MSVVPGAKAIGDYLAPALGQTAPAYQPAHSDGPENEPVRKPLKQLELVTGIEPVTPSLRAVPDSEDGNTKR